MKCRHENKHTLNLKTGSWSCADCKMELTITASMIIENHECDGRHFWCKCVGEWHQAVGTKHHHKVYRLNQELLALKEES